MFVNIIRTIFCAAALVALFFFILPVTSGVVNIGNITGAALSIWVFCFSCKPIHHFFKNLFGHFALTRFVYYAVNGCFIALALLGITMTALMVYGMNQQPATNSTAVVLGAQVLPSGNPSTMLTGRIDAAEKYLKENPRAKAVLSGGKGSNEPVSEAQCMYERLTERGVSPERLYIEDRSTDTTENLRFSDEIIKREKLSNNLAIITDGFHQARARIVFSQLGLKGKIGAYNADTSAKYAATYYVREWFAIPNQVLFKHQ